MFRNNITSGKFETYRFVLVLSAFVILAFLCSPFCFSVEVVDAELLVELLEPLALEVVGVEWVPLFEVVSPFEGA